MTYGKRFTEITVGDVFDTIVKTPSFVTKGAHIKEAMDRMIGNPLSRKVYVVDEEGVLIGTITTQTILRLMGYRVGVREAGALSFMHLLKDILKEDISKITVEITPVTKDTKLTKALEIMLESRVNDLPVVDKDGKLIGELISLELFIVGRELFDRPDNLDVL